MSEQEQTHSRAQRWYALVSNDEDARACADISEQACRVVPGNFLLVLAALVLSKIADLLSSPRVALSWLLGSAGVPAAVVALAAPLRESGALIPQLALGAWVRRLPKRHGLWSLGALLQAVSMAGLLASLLLFDGIGVSVAVLVCLAGFALSRGLSSVAMKDVQGKTIPKGRRGRLTGLAGTLSGLAGVLVALCLWAYDGVQEAGALLLLCIALAGWLLAALLFLRVREEPGASEGGGNAMREALASLSLLRRDAPFRRFVVARALLMGPVLGMPLMVLQAQQSGGSILLLGGLLLATSLASLVSAWVWGVQADRSSRRVMVVAGALAALACAGAGLVLWLDETLTAAVLGTLVFVLALAHAGIRIGRKTYLLDLGGGHKRIDYVAVSNSVIGVLLLLEGALVAALATHSLALALVLLAASGFAGSLLSARLKAVALAG